MSRRVRETVEVVLPPARAEALWADVRRWGSFVEGFKHAVEVGDDWPNPGSKVIWESVPGGRGRVTERVRRREPASLLATEVFEERLAGTQTVRFAPAGDGGTRVEAELEYELARGGPLQALADLLFIRRALSDALARTLSRYAIEATEDAELR